MWILAMPGPGRRRHFSSDGSFAIAQSGILGLIPNAIIDILMTATSSGTAWCPRSTLDIIGEAWSGRGVLLSLSRRSGVSWFWCVASMAY